MASSEQRDLAPLPVYEMMRRLGIEVAGGVIPRHGLTFACAVRTCRQCSGRMSCRKWLEDASPALSLAPGFCPNADLLFQLMLDVPAMGPARASRATAATI